MCISKFINKLYHCSIIFKYEKEFWSKKDQWKVSQSYDEGIEWGSKLEIKVRIWKILIKRVTKGENEKSLL